VVLSDREAPDDPRGRDLAACEAKFERGDELTPRLNADLLLTNQRSRSN